MHFCTITVEPVIMNSPRWTYWAMHYGRLFIRREITKIYSKTTEFTYFSLVIYFFHMNLTIIRLLLRCSLLAVVADS